MWSWLRKLFDPPRTGSVAPSTGIETELGPPEDLSSEEGWDRYWQTRIDNRTALAIEAMMDVGFCQKQRQALLDTMRREQKRSILCVGNGLSGEAFAFQAAGCAVTILEKSPLAAAVARTMRLAPDFLTRFFERPSDSPGGSLDVVHGDLFDPAASPGPYDVVIERRTLQLWYAKEEFERGLEAVTGRLAPDGLFVTHVHLGFWRPDQPRDHFAEPWLRRHAFAIVEGHAEADQPGSGRRAWLFVTSG